MWVTKEALEILVKQSPAYFQHYGEDCVSFLDEVVDKIRSTEPDNNWGDLLQRIKWWFNSNAACHHAGKEQANEQSAVPSKKPQRLKKITVRSLARAKHPDLYEAGKQQAKAEGKHQLQYHKAAEDFMWSHLDKAEQDALQAKVNEIKKGNRKPDRMTQRR